MLPVVRFVTLSQQLKRRFLRSDSVLCSRSRLQVASEPPQTCFVRGGSVYVMVRDRLVVLLDFRLTEISCRCSNCQIQSSKLCLVIFAGELETRSSRTGSPEAHGDFHAACIDRRSSHADVIAGAHSVIVSHLHESRRGI